MAAARPLVVDDAGLGQLIVQSPGHDREHFVGLARQQQAGPARGHCLCQPLGHGVGVPRVVEPQVVVEIGQHLGAEETALGEQLGGPHAAVAEVLRQGDIEEHHRLERHRPVLGGAEGQGVDAGLPGQLRRRAPRLTSALAKRAPSMWRRMPATARELGNGLDLGRRVDRAGLARLGDRDRRGLGIVHAADEAVELALDRARGDLAAGLVEADQLGPAGEQFRRAALVDHDVGVGVAQHRAIGRRHGRQRQRVGGRPGHHQERAQVPLEHLAQARSARFVQSSSP
jgi:hypothetical protein